MSTEKNGKNLEYMSMEESQEVMVKGNAYEKGRGKKQRSSGRCGWFRRRTTMEKFLILLLLFLILVCIILLVSLVVTAAYSVPTVELWGEGESSTSPSRSTTEGTCTTPECVIAAGTVLSSMDLTADPCQDFYQYACGGWNGNKFIPDEESKYTVFEEILNRLMEMSRGLLEETSTNDSEAVSKAKGFYAACTNEDKIEQYGTQPLLDLLDYLGGWPVIAGDSWDEEAWDIVDVLAKSRLELDYNYLFSHNVDPDIVNSDVYIITALFPGYRQNIRFEFFALRNFLCQNPTRSPEHDAALIDQPVLSLKRRSFYFREKKDKKLAAYLEYMVNTATMLRPDHDRDEAQRQMEDALEFESALANFSASLEERRDVTKLNNRYTVTKLQTDMPEIDWLRYFRKIHTDDFSPDEEMLNFSPEYFEKLAVHISSTPKRTIANFLMWRIVFIMSEYLNTELRDIRQQFLWTTMGEKREKNRWKICFKKTNDMFGMAMGSLFIQTHFDDETKAAAQEMLEDIRETLKHTLNEVPWMDEQTKALATRKASKMMEKIGYDDILKDDQAVNFAYKSVEMSPEHHFENVRALWRADAQGGISNYGKPVERGIWKKTPIDINAYYTNQNNEIIFPAGIFQPPFYSSRFPKAMNYGGIGMVMGHELMHGFDDRGRKFDEDGNINQWFSNSSKNAYQERTKCFIDQYSSYYVPEVNLYVNGVITLGEVLADNGGIKEAYLGYKRWEERAGNPGDTLPGINLNHDQLFFLNFAQLWCSLHRREHMELMVHTSAHPPEKFRVLGTLSNSEYFADAYQCKKGSPMVRDEPCKLW